MQNLKQIFRQPLAEVGSGAVAAFMAVALLGFADAAFLAIEHFLGKIPPCTLTSGCETVLTSPYAYILGIPVSVLGALWYLAMALGAFVYLESRHGGGGIAAHHSAILKWTLLGTAVCFSMSVWFVWVQAAVIGSFCQYCLGSALVSTVLFAMAATILWKKTSASS